MLFLIVLGYSLVDLEIVCVYVCFGCVYGVLFSWVL